MLNRNECYDFIFKNSLNAIIEKPAFTNLEDFKKIKNKIIGNNSKIIYGFNRRFYNNVNYLKSLIDNNIFGPIKSVSISEGYAPTGMMRNNDWYIGDSTQSGGGILIETGSHAIDTLNYIFQPEQMILKKYIENYSYNNIEMDIQIIGNIEQNSSDKFNFEINLSYLKNLENVVRINFNEITLIMENTFLGGIYIEKNGFKLKKFDIDVDTDINLVFKKQLMYF